MMESLSGWVLAPAYDLLNVAILIPEDTEELALALIGKRRNWGGVILKNWIKIWS